MTTTSATDTKATKTTDAIAPTRYPRAIIAADAYCDLCGAPAGYGCC